MGEHEHDWKGLGLGKFRCACGATGWRFGRRAITAHAQPVQFSDIASSAVVGVAVQSNTKIGQLESGWDRLGEGAYQAHRRPGADDQDYQRQVLGEYVEPVPSLFDERPRRRR